MSESTNEHKEKQEIYQKEANVVYHGTYLWLRSIDDPFFNESNKITDKDPESIEKFKEKAKLIRTLLIEEIDEMVEAIETGNELEAINAQADLLVVASNLGFYAGIVGRAVDLEVKATLTSNRSKFDRSKEDAERTKEAYENNTHPNSKGSPLEVYTDEKDGVFVTRRTSDSKILKSLTFKDVNELRLEVGGAMLVNLEDVNLTAKQATIDSANLSKFTLIQAQGFKDIDQVSNNIIILKDGTTYAILPEWLEFVQDVETTLKAL